MTKSRFRPRDFCAQPAAFGRAAELEWLPQPSDPTERFQWRAAQIQHLYATRIRRVLNDKFIGLAVYAQRAGMSYDRATKILRGDVIMRLEDIAAADIVLGGILLGQFANPATAATSPTQTSTARPTGGDRQMERATTSPRPV